MSIYLDKIKSINKITLTKICKELNINRSNLLNGKSTEENEKKVYYQLLQEIEKIKNK